MSDRHAAMIGVLFGACFGFMVGVMYCAVQVTIDPAVCQAAKGDGQ